MHSQLSGKPATEPEAGNTTKSGADVKLPEGIEDHQNPKPLSPGLAFLIGAVARMAQEVRPPIWLDPPPPPAPPVKPKPGAITKEGLANE